MEQPGLVHHEGIIHHDHESIHDQHFGKDLSRPKISLRSLSKSDPHLNIPHLMVSQDEHHPSLNKFVSGLFHVNSALRTPISSSTHLAHLNDPNTLATSKNNLVASESSATLLGDSSPQPPTLRKSSSAIDWSAAAAEDNRKRHDLWVSPLVDHPSDPHLGLSQFNQGYSAASAPLLDHQGGLVMNSSPSNPSMSLAPLTSTGPFSKAIASSAPSTVVSANPLEPQGNHDRKSHGMFGNMFRQGFFSRPVVRTEEENYRYLMALDR